jgi:predicted YcjX-like family ATPase
VIGDLGDIGLRAADGLAQVASRLSGGTLRLGVTGLRRSGKTVFVTSLLHNLLSAGAAWGGRLPLLDVVSQGRFVAAKLKPQPDAAVPRFDYEGRLAELTADPPAWPRETKAISEIRIALRFRPGGLLARRLGGISTCTLDIVDYPGEWLLDLPMLGQDYADWSRTMLDLAVRPPRDGLSAEWRAALGAVDAGADSDESTARRLAALYTAYLRACRAATVGLSLIQPGRFVEPGEMEGAPILTFCPLPVTGRPAPGSLAALMAERFDGYKEAVVRRFYRDHISRLDRQIVLVDALSALNAGAAGLDDLERSLAATLESFRHGTVSWLGALGGARIDRVLFAATKADHVAGAEHDNLAALLDSFLAAPMSALRFSGAEVRTMAIASVRSTDSVLTDYQGRQLACVQGIPVGRTEPTVLYPGAVPANHRDLGPADGWGSAGRFAFTPFAPPAGLGRDGRGLPNIRLDRALQFLIGDFLA